MTSTYTTNKGLELPGYNDYVDTWNVPVNADFTLIDTALGGSTLLNVTGVAGDVTLTATQYRPPQLIISGTLTANVRFLIPSTVGGQWTVTNGATGAFAITLASAAGGSNVTIPSGTTIVSCDGSVSGMRLSITSTSVQRVDAFSAGSTGLTPAYAAVGSITLGGTLNIANGGTGNTTAPTSGQLLIGKNDGTYNVANILSGSGITITNGDGSITINASSTAGGTVKNVGLSGGTTGLTVATSTTNPITDTGTFTLQGTLNYSAGGTGYSTVPGAGQLLIGNGVTGYTLATISASSPITVANGAGTISLSLSTVPVANGGTGTTTSTGTGSVVLSSSPTLSSPTFTTPVLGTPTSGNLSNCTGFPAGSLSGTVSLTSQVTGTLPISNGGTNATSASGALSNLGAAGLTTNTFSGTQTAPQYSLASNNARFYTGSGGTAGYTIIDFNASSNLYYNGSNQYEFSIQGNARLTITNSGIQAVSYSNYSDRALKKDITPVQGGLGRVLQYQPVTFKWLDPSINGDRLNEGFIAQDVATINPIPVTYDHNGVALLDYGPLVADLVSAIQELTAQVQAMKTQLGIS